MECVTLYSILTPFAFGGLKQRRTRNVSKDVLKCKLCISLLVNILIKVRVIKFVCIAYYF